MASLGRRRASTHTGFRMKLLNKVLGDLYLVCSPLTVRAMAVSEPISSPQQPPKDTQNGNRKSKAGGGEKKKKTMENRDDREKGILGF